MLTVPLGLSQHVVGIGITLLATSLQLLRLPAGSAEGDLAAEDRAVPAAADPRPVATSRPRRGAVPQTPLTYLAFVTVAVVAWVLYRTPLGLALRAAGENPSAVEAQGISVTAIRMGAVMAGSALMAVGGAFLTMSAFNSFFFEMINGRGWICIALVVFGSWRPGKALLGAILFAAFDAYQVACSSSPAASCPTSFLMLPYALSILALILVARRATYPKALMIPIRRASVRWLPRFVILGLVPRSRLRQARAVSTHPQLLAVLGSGPRMTPSL